LPYLCGWRELTWVCEDTTIVIAGAGLSLAATGMLLQRVFVSRSRRPDAILIVNRVAILLALLSSLIALLHCH